MSTPYHRGYRLPFPVLMVTLRGEETEIGPLPALLDSGADSTLMPESILDRLALDDSGWVIIRTHFGHSQRARK